MTDADGSNQSDVQATDAQASVLMQRGIALMSEDRAGAASEALACFDQALELREGLPNDESPMLRYGLAACWLNRADALMRLGGAPQVAEALRSCDQAIGLLSTLPFEQDARFLRRLAIAHHNRGLFLQVQGTSPASDVVTAFDAAAAALDHQDAAGIADRQYLQAVVCMNLASVLSVMGPGSEVRARDAAIRALAYVADVEGEDLAAAEVGLKSRHALCRVAAGRLSAAQPEPQEMPEDVHEATDAVDDGLALVRQWERKGVGRFRMVAADLFRFGSRVYLIYQPQFLQEFLDENLDPAASSADYVQDAEISAAAQEIVDLHNRLHA